MRRICLTLLLFALFVPFTALHSAEAGAKENADLNKYLDPAFWKKQALEDIIPFWEKTIDKKNGGFFTDVNRDGSIGSETGKYPRMLSRMVFAYSTAYLLSGDEKYLKFAQHGLTYLTNNGWDKEHGGWYQYIKQDNHPMDSDKDLFDETYGNLGPVVYYFTTHDAKTLSFVEITHRLMQTKAWDKDFKGYYAEVNSDWSTAGTRKSFNAEIDTCSAYLVYYYMATKDPALLKDLRQIADTAIEHMINPDNGLVGESFSREWRSLDPWLWVGHNLKTAWVMMRTYWLTGDKKYADAAQKIAAAQLKYSWDSKNYGWFFKQLSNSPSSVQDVKDWWTQEEGNVLMLNLYRLSTNSLYLNRFKECSYFWDKYMIDHQYKECYPTVSAEGNVLDNKKGHLYKAGYHSMEQTLFNYLYTSLYVKRQDAELYFNLSSDGTDEKHYVKIVEAPDVIIKSVEINGKAWKQFNPEEGYITLPKGTGMKTKVIFSVKG